MFRKAYIPDVPSSDVEDVGPTKDNTAAAITSTNAQAVPAAYPLVQPMKAALYFDTVDGFGDWRIYISTRADGNLRETRKKDPALFKIIIKKIKYVSMWGLVSLTTILLQGAFQRPFFGR